MLRLALIEAVGNLLAARQRSALALLGIMVGAGAVIAMLTVGAIAREETARQFRAMGTDILLVRSEGPEGPGRLPLAELEALPGRVAGLAQIAPFMLGGGQLSAEGRSRSASFAGVTEAFQQVARLRLAEGRFISRHDRFEPFAVLGADLAEQLSTPFSRIRLGSEIRVGGYVFTVIGLLEPAVPSPMMPLDAGEALFVSMPNARRIMSHPNLSWAVARAGPAADPEAVAQRVQAELSALAGQDRVQVVSARALLAGLAGQMRLFTLLLGAVAAIALVLGGVGVMNIMLVSVQERRREIGVRLAIGATRRNIQSLFLTEAALLSLLGGAFGIVLGIAGAWGFTQLSGWGFVLPAGAIPLGAGVSVATGLFFGFYPALMASRLDPIVALRTE